METLSTLGFDSRVVKYWMRFQAHRRGCQLHCGPYAWDLKKDSRVIRISRRQFASVGHLADQFDGLFKTLEASKAGSQTLLDFSRVHTHKYRVPGLTFELAQWPEPDASIEAYFEWYKPSPTDLVFDLGAECGVATCVLSHLTGSVVAFEPDANMRVILERNVARHKLTNVLLAKRSAASLAGLISVFGQPAFCRINLDQVAPEFLQNDARSWTSRPILLSAHSQSSNVRKRFNAFLNANGFETASNHLLGITWARPPGVTC